MERFKKKLQQELENDLSYGGFLIPDKINETDLIKHTVMASRYATKVLNLTIAPTSNCNFRCPYCYERNSLNEKRMNDTTANDILKMIEDRIPHLEAIDLTWYGGEPLLELERILNLSTKIIKICEENNVEYYGSMVTNGYFLRKDTLEKLMNVKIKNIQITLDGTKEFHDSRRYRIRKKPTFETITQNLKSIKNLSNDKNFPIIGIRMNIDKNNIYCLSDLEEYLSKTEINKYTTFYIAAVFDPEDSNNEYTYTAREFAQINDKFNKSKDKTNFSDYYPSLLGNHCMCDSLYGMVIDADGSIYKCWEEMGRKDCKVGDISNYKIIPNNPIYYSYLLSNIFENEKCKNCPILPLCMGGGCPERIIQHKYQPDCEYMLASIYENIEKSYEIAKRIR